MRDVPPRLTAGVAACYQELLAFVFVCVEGGEGRRQEAGGGGEKRGVRVHPESTQGLPQAQIAHLISGLNRVSGHHELH